MMSWSKFLTISTVILVSLIGTVCLINYNVDPLLKLRLPKNGPYFSSEREYKALAINTYPHNAIVIGSSLIANGMDPQLIDTKNLHFFNAAFSGATPEEMYWYLEKYALNLDLIVIGYDFASMNENSTPISNETFKQDQSFPSLFSYLFSWDTFEYSILSYNYIRKHSLPSVFQNGKRNSIERDREDQQTKGLNYEAGLDYIFNDNLKNFKYSDTRISFILKTKKLLESRKIKRLVFISPTNVQVVEGFKKEHHYDSFLRFRNDIKSIFTNTVDFSESKYSQISCFYKGDPSHYLPRVGSEIMSDLLKLPRFQKLK